nr:hypothetical protein [uncultured Kingella sp.]
MIFLYFAIGNPRHMVSGCLKIKRRVFCCEPQGVQAQCRFQAALEDEACGQRMPPPWFIPNFR